MARRARVGALVSLNSLPPDGGDTLYIGQAGGTSTTSGATMVFAIQPLPIQDFIKHELM